MTTIKQIFETFGPEYLRLYENRMPKVHEKTMQAIINCRTDHYGLTIYRCEECGTHHQIYRSCGNRHCPNCQYHKSRQWLDTQLKRQLGGHHFMITFTVPQEARPFIRANQRACYNAMFKASSQAMKILAADENFIGGDLPGFFGVLHTWGRQLQYHPHIHYVVPGGAISKEDQCWHPSQLAFYLPVKAISKIYKAKFRDEMKRSGLYSKIPRSVWEKNWIVNCQAIGSATASLKYLSPYVFKVAISDSRIVKVEDGRVFFRYRKHKSNRWRTICVDAMEFIRRFLQHVLPTGFMKIRYYGFLSPGCSISLEKIRERIEAANDFMISLPVIGSEPVPKPTCSQCGGILKYLASVLPYQMVPIGTG